MKTVALIAAALVASTAIASAATPAAKPSATPTMPPMNSGTPRLQIMVDGKDGRCKVTQPGPLELADAGQLFAIMLSRSQAPKGVDGDLALRARLREAEVGVERCLAEAGLLR